MVTWSFPTTIVFGNAAIESIADHVKRLGKSRALLVSDAGVSRAGLVARAEELLAKAGLHAATFTDVDPNPVEKNIEDGARAYKTAGADVVVAVGGGSPLDAAKLIALRTTHHEPLEKYDDATGGDRYIEPNVPPIITVPTTAGTGSEVGRSGVVTLAATGRKTVIFSPHLLAKVAILDPELTVSMPAKVTAATGFDALTHCLEAYCSLGDHPMADAIAIGGLELVSQNLLRAIDAPKDLEARGAMMKAAMMGAVAFQKGLGACHSLAHPLSSEKGMHHGLANALCLPAVVEYNEPEVHDGLELIRAMFDPSAKTCAQALRSFRRRCGLPEGLAAEGVRKEDIAKLADKAHEDACWRSNPRQPITRDILAELYEASL